MSVCLSPRDLCEEGWSVGEEEEVHPAEEGETNLPWGPLRGEDLSRRGVVQSVLDEGPRKEEEVEEETGDELAETLSEIH